MVDDLAGDEAEPEMTADQKKVVDDEAARIKEEKKAEIALAANKQIWIWLCE